MKLTPVTVSILLGTLLLHVVIAVEKSGSCPGAPERPADGKSGEEKNLCDDDDFMCKGTKKCCPSFYDNMCTEPGPVKKGFCPAYPSSAYSTCKRPIQRYCDFDSDCPGKKKCCKPGCIIECHDPWAEKPGKCPASPKTSTPCRRKISKKNHHCKSDRDCKGKRKCCLYACQYLCKSPKE